jgi:hypothetical protein
MKKEQIVDIKTLTIEERKLLLKAFDYDVEDNRIFYKGIAVHDRYTGDEIKFDNVDILPDHNKGLVLINDEMFSIMCYFEEFEK